MTNDAYNELERRIQQAIAEDDFDVCDGEDCDLTEEGIEHLAQIAVAQTQALVSELWEEFDTVARNAIKEGRRGQ